MGSMRLLHETVVFRMLQEKIQKGKGIGTSEKKDTEIRILNIT